MAGMQVLKYIKGTLHYGITYTKGSTFTRFYDSIIFIIRINVTYGTKLLHIQLLRIDVIASMDPNFNIFVLLNEGKLFHAHIPKSMRDFLGE